MPEPFDGVKPDTLVSFKSGGVSYTGRLKAVEDGAVVLSELVFDAKAITNAKIGAPAPEAAPEPKPASKPTKAAKE